MVQKQQHSQIRARRTPVGKALGECTVWSLNPHCFCWFGFLREREQREQREEEERERERRERERERERKKEREREKYTRNKRWAF